MIFQRIKRKILNTGAYWISLWKLRPLLSRLDSNSVVIDCGANVGDISHQFAQTGATVYAFEPDPLAFSKLNKRFEKHEKVSVYQQAVWTEDAMLPLFFHNSRMKEELELTVSSSLLSYKSNVNLEQNGLVEAIDLLEFINKLKSRVNLIKIDIEGAEVEILKKIISTEAYKKFDLAVVETHESKIPGHVKEIALIKSLLKENGIDNIKLNWI